MEILDYVTIYGAIAGTAAVIWKGIDYYRDRTYIKVKVQWAYRYCGVPGFTPEEDVCLTAINKGRRPVTISSAGICLSKHALIPYIGNQDELPKRLEEGQDLDLYIEFSKLKDGLTEYSKKKGKVEIKYVFFRDKTDRLYKVKVPKEMKKKLISQ